MSPRYKKLIGLALLLPALVAYFFAAAALGEFVPDTQLLKLPYFIVAGVAWAFPTVFFIRWMERDKRRDNAPDRR